VLEVETKLLRPVRENEGRIAVGDAHGFDRARSGEAVRKCSRAATRSGSVGSHAQHTARVLFEVNFQCRIEFKESAHLRVPDVIKAGFERVAANVLGDVVLELELALERLLWNVSVGAELRGRECDERSARGAVNQVVPV